MSIDQAYQALLAFALAVLTVLALLCLVRCVLGPRISDRVLAINMIGTLTVIMLAVSVVLLGEGSLADIALIYAMLSFLAVILLSKVYTGIYQERKHEEALAAERAAQGNKEAGTQDGMDSLLSDCRAGARGPRVPDRPGVSPWHV